MVFFINSQLTKPFVPNVCLHLTIMQKKNPWNFVAVIYIKSRYNFFYVELIIVVLERFDFKDC